MTTVPAGSLPVNSRFRAPTGDDLRMAEHTVTRHRPTIWGIPGTVWTTAEGQEWACLASMPVEPLKEPTP